MGSRRQLDVEDDADSDDDDERQNDRYDGDDLDSLTQSPTFAGIPPDILVVRLNWKRDMLYLTLFIFQSLDYLESTLDQILVKLRWFLWLHIANEQIELFDFLVYNTYDNVLNLTENITENQVTIWGTLPIVRNLENKVLFVWQFSSKGILDMLLLQCIFVLVQYCQVHFSIFNLRLKLHLLI